MIARWQFAVIGALVAAVVGHAGLAVMYWWKHEMYFFAEMWRFSLIFMGPAILVGAARGFWSGASACAEAASGSAWKAAFRFVLATYAVYLPALAVIFFVAFEVALVLHFDVARAGLLSVVPGMIGGALAGWWYAFVLGFVPSVFLSAGIFRFLGARPVANPLVVMP